MALFKKNKKEEETGPASSSRIAEAVRNIFNATVQGQQKAVQADQAVARETNRQVTTAARNIIDATTRGQQAATRADQAVAGAQNRRLADAAAGLYSAYQQQQERTARDQMARQQAQMQAPTQRAQDAAAGLYSAYLQQQESLADIQRRQNRSQADTMAGLYANAADSLRGANELYQKQLAGTDTGNRANELMTQPVLERANQRQSSLVIGDPKKGAGKYLKYMSAADFSVNSQARTDSKDETYNYINNLNGERERQQGYAMQRGADSGMEKYQLMTDEERGVYNYLYNTQGKTAANGFLARIDAELNEQYYSGQSKYQTELANQDAGSRLAFSAATVAQQPVRTLNSLAAITEDAIKTMKGEEIDPNSTFRRASALTQDIRKELATYYDQQYPGKILGISAGDVYQSVMSAMDSWMNMATAGMLGQGAAAIKGADDVAKVMDITNRLGAALMSSEVAATGIAESKRNGYSNVGAMSLGMIRGGIEYLSEKLGGDWVIKWLKQNPASMVRTLVHAMVPEGMEEVMSDFGNEVVNGISDWLFHTNESYVRQAYEQFKADGSDSPLRDTIAAVALQEWKSFAGGALSAAGSGTTFYMQNRSSINETARQLNTDANGVVQLMNDIGTDNPDAVRMLAEVSDATSVDQVREKAAQYETVNAAIDAVMQERGARDTENAMRANAGGMTYATEGGSIGDVTYNAVDRSKLNNQQKAIADTTERIAKILGVNVTVIDARGDLGGAYLGNGNIYLNIGAGTNLKDYGKAIASASFTHELTHWMQDQAQEEYEELKRVTTGAMSSEQLQQLIEEQMKNQPGLTPEQAMDEVVANACQNLLQDSKAFARLAVENQSLAQKILAFLRDFTQRMREAFAEVDFSDNLPIYHAVQAVEDHLDEMQKAFDEALLAARGNTQAQTNENTAGEGGVQYQAMGANSIQEHEAIAAVYDALDHKDEGYDNLIKVSRMPAFLRDLVGVDGDLYIYRDHTYENIKTEKEAKEEGRYSTSAHYHGIGEEKYIDAIMSLDHPAITINDGDGKGNPQIIMVLPVVGDGGSPLVAALGFYVNRPINGQFGIRPHITLSIYERLEGEKNERGREYRGLAEILDDAIDSGKIISYDKEISDGLPVIAQHSRLGNVTESSLNKNLAQFQQEVKDFRARNKISYQTWNSAESAGETVGVTADEQSESVAPIQFSRFTWNESDYVQNRTEAARDIASALGVSRKTAERYIDSVNGVAKAIADDAQRLDYEASPDRSSLVGNTEYGGSIDFSTLCKKRRVLTGTFTAIQQALPNTALTAEEVLQIRKMMKDRGYEVSCGLCYVEGSRAKMGEYAKQFLDEYAKTDPEYLPNMAEINTPEGLEQIRMEHPEIYEAYEKFMNKLAQRKPKLYQLATEYKNEILKKFQGKKAQVDKYNRNGGLRLQSFSDFEIIHLIDNMQVIMDMARVGLNGQAYTKVPEFAWAMGRTGLKINLSLIAEGVDENGNLILDEVEGMKRADAAALRNNFSDTVGTIVVVFNDEQLKAAMKDEFIDFIIPFHRSQWNKAQYELMGLPEGAKDYTPWQNESYAEPVYNKNGKPMRPDNYMPNEYWDFSKTGKENAETYLRMCAQNNRTPKFSNLLDRNADGSYSLKKDGSTDGYWKLLIDFKMYNNDGVGVPQQPVQPIFNDGPASDPHSTLGMLEAYKGGHQSFPVAQDVVDDFVKQYKQDNPRVQYQTWGAQQFNSREEIDAEIERIQNQIRDIQEAQRQALDEAKADPRVQEKQKAWWAAEDRGENAFTYKVEYRRTLNQVKAELNAQIPEGDLNELAQRIQDLRKEREDFISVTPITNEQYDQLADHFGTTDDFDVAGFILTDGRMLDFSGKKQYGKNYAGGREVYHNEVGDVLDLPTDTSPRINMVSNGNIRLVPEINGINLSQKPTVEQRRILREYINHHNGDVHIDIDNRAGRTLETMGYRTGTPSTRILADIDSYFDTGEVTQRPAFEQFLFQTWDGGDIRRQLADAEREYMEHSDANDAEYDYRAQLEKINDLRRQIEEAESVNAEADNVNAETDTNPTIEALEREGRVSRGTYDVEKYGDTHPERGEVGRDGVRMCNTTADLEAELNEIGGARIRNDTGEYFARIRRKNDNGYLLTINRDGKRDTSRSFADYKEASAYAASYIEGQTQARTDAELDNEKSAPVPRQEPIEAMTTGQVQDEAKRQKKNKAAEASTQSLRDRIRKTDEEIKALRRLEKTTGLTELQAQHKADLQETLEILNDELTSRKGRAKAKKEKVEVKGNKPVRSAAEAKNRLMEIFHTAAGQKADTGTKLEAKLAEIVSSGKITEQNRDDILDMLIDAGMVRQEAEQEYRDVRDWLRGSRIYVSEHDRADFGDDWEGIRKSAWANGIYLTSNESDRSVDSLVSELAETFGTNMFPTDDAPSDMVRNLIEQAEKGRSQMITFAEAVNNEARMEHVDPQEIWNDLSRQADETLRAFAEKAKLEMDLKDRTASMLATERKRAEDRMERMAQRRRESEIREKTFKAIRRLKKLRGKAAADVKTQIDEAIRDIDTQARQLTINGLEDLQELARVYEDAKKAAGYVDEENPGNFLKNPYIEDQLDRLKQKHINEMDIDDVIELGRVVAALENTVKTNGKMIGEQFDSEVKTVADKVNAEVQSSRGAGVSGLKGFAQKWFKEEQLAPRRFLEMLGGWKKGAVANLADSLEKGQTRMLDFQRRAMQSMDPFMDKYKKWVKTASGKNAKWYTYSVANGMAMDGSGITGQTIEITPMMKVSLYLMSLNEDNLRHIQTGGLRIPDKALYLKGKTQEAFAQGQQVKMQPQAVRAIASTLTQEEKTFAQYLQKFFDSQSKDAINEVSVQLDGFERADVENYFPIESYSSYIKSDVSGEARAATVEGIGSIANERVHAGNPIKLDDAYNVWMRQVEKVSRYYGYAIPIRNFQAVNNYVFHEEGNAFAGSIKDTINRKWGTGAENYITKMLKDIQSGSQRNGDLMSSGMAKMRSNLAGATLTLNAKVAMTQAASYPGAAQAVGWDGLAAGLVSGPVDEKLIEKYTPLLWYRSQGYSTQEIGDAMSAQNKTLPQKALGVKLLNWIQGVDILTVRRLWKAAEYRVTKDTGLKPGSKALIDSGMDPYYQKVAEVFNRAVYDTQPNYTEMERAQILRSDSDVTKFFTMYKTVPLQYYGMMTEAVGRLQAAQKSGNKAEIATARRYAANTFAGLIAANAVYSAIGKAMKGFLYGKKDDEDEESAANDLKQLGIDTAETFAGSVIGGAELWSLMESALTGKKWNAPQMNILTAVEDIWTNMQSVFKAWDSEDPQKIAKAVRETAKNVSSAVGIPLKNIENLALAITRWRSPEAAMQYDAMFGGIDKTSLKTMDPNIIGSAASIIMNSRTGVNMERAATDELSRLYAAGYTEAIPTAIKDSFEYGGNEVKIKDKRKYSETWGGVVGDNLEELTTSESYINADDKTKEAMIRKLYQYATVQARMGADPEYTAEGSSTYGWTEKADAAMESGMDLPTVIAAMTTMSSMTADKVNGQTVKTLKSKRVEYIDGLKLDTEQKDALYELAGYDSGLEKAPWHSGISAEAGYATGTNKPVINEAARKRAVEANYQQLTESAAYKAADDQTKKAMIEKLNQYAEVQGMVTTDPDYLPTGTAGWTVWAETAEKAGIDLISAIDYATQLDSFKADYNEYGKAISGSKKDKVTKYIDALDLTNEQKDILYLKIYAENSLKYTPWHGYTGKKKKRRGGGRRGSGKKSTAGKKPVSVGKITPKYNSGIDISTLFPTTTTKKSGSGLSSDLAKIVSSGLDISELFKLPTTGTKAPKGRTTVDFKL